MITRLANFSNSDNLVISGRGYMKIKNFIGTCWSLPPLCALATPSRYLGDK